MKKLIWILLFFLHVTDADNNNQGHHPLFYPLEPRTLNLFENEEKQDLVIQNSDVRGKLNLFDGKTSIQIFNNGMLSPIPRWLVANGLGNNSSFGFHYTNV